MSTSTPGFTHPDRWVHCRNVCVEGKKMQMRIHSGDQVARKPRVLTHVLGQRVV